MACRDWVKGGDLSGPNIQTTRELLAVSRHPRNTPANMIAEREMFSYVCVEGEGGEGGEGGTENYLLA